MGTSRFSDRKTVVALALLCCLLWGSSYPAIKTGYELFGIAAHDVPTKLVFAGWRFLWAGLALLVLAMVTRRQVWGLGAGAARQLVVLGWRRPRCSTCSSTWGWPTPRASRAPS